MAFRTTSAEDRFGFSTSGKVRIQDRFEKPLLVGSAAVGVLGAIIIFAFVGVVDSMGLFNLLLKSGVAFVWVFVWMTLASIVLTGEQWNYDANEKQFRLSGPNKPEEIFYYEDIEEVRFTPLFLFRFERGYRVTIRTKYREFTYSYIYTKNKVNRTPEGSPFYIIVERSGLVRGESADNSIIYTRRTEQ
ncbi:MAG: hypothetical protein ACI4KM_11020 [Oscillospiraceae bacterium]